MGSTMPTQNTGRKAPRSFNQLKVGSHTKKKKINPKARQLYPKSRSRQSNPSATPNRGALAAEVETFNEGRKGMKRLRRPLRSTRKQVVAVTVATDIHAALHPA